jgi:hypothetical protein
MAATRVVGVLAVKTEAVFGVEAAHGVPLGVAAHVTVRVDYCATDFDLGTEDGDQRRFEARCDAGWRPLEGTR